MPIFHDGEADRLDGLVVAHRGYGRPAARRGDGDLPRGDPRAGLKVVEGGEFREDVFKTIVEQCRDPEYVGLDLKSRIAANNVCDRRYLQLVEQLRARNSWKPRARSSSATPRRWPAASCARIPDGTWRSRLYGTTPRAEDAPGPGPYRRLRDDQAGDKLSMDLGGHGRADAQRPQLDAAQHAGPRRPSRSRTSSSGTSRGATASWHRSRVSVPGGSILNCRFPAACGFAPWRRADLVAALSECLAKMLSPAG